VAIFPKLKTEKTVQVDDKIRFDASKSFVSDEASAITALRIKPDTAESFVDVFSSDADDWFLDWQYATDGTKTVSVEVSTDGAPVISTFTVEAVTVVDDALFSTDDDLLSMEEEILDLLPDRYSSWNHIHRRAQKRIINHFRMTGVKDTSGNYLTKAAVVDNEEVREWSASLTMHLIYMDISNSSEDRFSEKSMFYESQAQSFSNRQSIALDLDGDGEQEAGENVRISSVRAVRR